MWWAHKATLAPSPFLTQYASPSHFYSFLVRSPELLLTTAPFQASETFLSYTIVKYINLHEYTSSIEAEKLGEK
jgi:uncharacterized membrane protein YobD (UPF0266 family)